MAKGSNPNSKKNLKSFEKGVSGNPKGRPLGSISLKERMDKFMSLKLKVKMPDGTITEQEVADNIIMSLLSQAQKGNIPAIKEVLDRYYGKETQPIDLMTKEKEEVTITMEERMKKYVNN